MDRPTQQACNTGPEPESCRPSICSISTNPTESWRPPLLLLLATTPEMFNQLLVLLPAGSSGSPETPLQLRGSSAALCKDEGCRES